jgi:hypothetical protein
VPPGANGVVRVDFPVHGKSYVFADYLRAQVVQSALEEPTSRSWWVCLFQVAHEADAYPNFIDILTMDMPAFQLLCRKHWVTNNPHPPSPNPNCDPYLGGGTTGAASGLTSRMVARPVGVGLSVISLTT